MYLKTIIKTIEDLIPLYVAESYDNCGLQLGNVNSKIDKILICLECTNDVIDEAIDQNAQLIITHHPLIFTPLKSLKESLSTNKLIVKLIKNNIALYSAHTNLDNLIYGVNKKNADKLNLKNIEILSTKQNILKKLIVFVPLSHVEQVKETLFEAGAGKLGNYEKCSFTSEGIGSFKPMQSAQPFSGTINKISSAEEKKIEVIYPVWIENELIQSLLKVHPYEEVAFDSIYLTNNNKFIGSGIVGDLKKEIDTYEFINKVKGTFNSKVIKHTAIIKKKIKKVAFCGGSGSFLIENAIKAKADVLITSDIKYHDFFRADDKIILLDVGHYESEQYVPELISEIISTKMPKLEFFISKINTNPIFYIY